MKHLICPFWPCRACWVCVLEMMGGPEGERRGIGDNRRKQVTPGRGWHCHLGAEGPMASRDLDSNKHHY